VQVQNCLFVASQDAVVVASSRTAPEYCLMLEQRVAGKNGRLTYGAVHRSRGDELAGWIKARCKDLSRVPRQLHDGRLEHAGARDLSCLSAIAVFSDCAFHWLEDEGIPLV